MDVNKHSHSIDANVYVFKGSENNLLSISELI